MATYQATGTCNKSRSYFLHKVLTYAEYVFKRYRVYKYTSFT